MTGSFHRQLSSTTEKSNQSKGIDEIPTADLSVFKRIPCASEADSGNDIEDIEFQFEQMAISNDGQSSVQSASPIFDEGYSENERELDPQIAQIQDDVQLARFVPDETKKDFCNDTTVAFHGEFARLISVPLALEHNFRCYLFSEEEICNENLSYYSFAYTKVDNAKAQFQCPNVRCKRSWTSMRARIAFTIAHTAVGCFIILKIAGQRCKSCATHTDALWYIDEVCRVMKNLAQSIYTNHFPDMLSKVDLEIQKTDQNISRMTRHPNHDPTQRHGKMLAEHKREFCEACQHGWCFPQN